MTDLSAPEIVECDIYGHTLDGLVIAGGADPKVLKNRIRLNSTTFVAQFLLCVASMPILFSVVQKWPPTTHLLARKSSQRGHVTRCMTVIMIDSAQADACHQPTPSLMLIIHRPLLNTLQILPCPGAIS